MLYIPKYFKPEELVPHEIILAKGAIALQVMDDRILQTADQIREYFAAAVEINNWMSGGQFSYRGFRTPQYSGYKVTSQHSHGRAIDFDVSGKTAEQVRTIILANKDKFPFIAGMETGTSWVHVDCRCTTPIQLFQPD